MECALVGGGELVRAQSQSAPLLQAVDAPLDGVALLACLGVEGGRSAAAAASPQPVADLNGGPGKSPRPPTPTATYPVHFEGWDDPKPVPKPTASDPIRFETR